MARTNRRPKTPRRQYKGEDQVDTTTKAHVPQNKKYPRNDRDAILEELVQMWQDLGDYDD